MKGGIILKTFFSKDKIQINQNTKKHPKKILKNITKDK